MPPRGRGEGGLYRPTYKDKDTHERRESAVWWISYRRGGQTIRESTGTSKRSDALKLLQQRLSDVARGRPVGPDLERTTFDELARLLDNDYVVNKRDSTPRMRQSVAHLREHFGSARALEITTDRILAYTRVRLEEGAANATINRELAALKRMFKLGDQAGRVVRRPYIPMLRESDPRKGFFEPAEFDAVLQHLPDELRAVAQTAYITGWRVPSEVVTRQWRHVDFAAGWLRLEPGETKNGHGRMFPLTPKLRSVLEERRRRTDALERATGHKVEWVFWRERARGVPEAGARVLRFDDVWKRACAKAGVPGRILHDFRRTAVRNLERAGVPRSAAMAMVGHKTEAIYRRYAITDEAMLREGAAKLAALHDLQSASLEPAADSSPER